MGKEVEMSLSWWIKNKQYKREDFDYEYNRFFLKYEVKLG
jgi:hypothetical protein